jgi:RsiW-degrading membrane proteinase PrsW (M82 family)
MPVLLYIRISLHGLELPPARRGWSIFGATLLTAPLIATLLEAIALGVILLAFILYARTVPGLTNSLNTLVDAFRSRNLSDDGITRLAASLAFAPGATISLLLTFSLAVPLIEETFKVIVIWFYLGRIRRPVDGFVLGVLCGAAFALTESLGFSSAGSADWLANAAARATAALPHILNSGLFGWALVSAWKEARYARLAGTFLTIILIHGTWNAISLGIALSEFSSYIADVPLLLQHSYPWYAAWILLALGSLGGLIFNNRQMRKQVANEQIEKLGYNSRLLSQTSGEDANGIDHMVD